MRPLRVLIVTNQWPDEARPWRGSYVKSQVDSLERAGVEIEVLEIRGSERRSAYASGIRATRQLSRSRPFDVVHAHYGHSGVVANMQREVPVVVSYFGSDVLGVRAEDGSLTRRGRVERAVFRQLGRVAAATITKSEEMERALPPACRERNHVIPNGVDMDRFRPIPRAEARARLGWDTDAPCAIFVGNPELPVKNFPLAEEAHRCLAASRPEVELRVAAEVEPEAIPLWMSAGDALLLTSRAEGSPNVVKEAMASELPIVATPVGDVRERLAGVEGCHVCEPDPGLLAAALGSAIDHGRTPAARAAVAPLGIDAVAQRVLSLYEEVLARPNGRRAGPPIS